MNIEIYINVLLVKSKEKVLVSFLPYTSTKEWRFASDSGTLSSEFTGTHGWYWRNLSNEEITIRLILKGEFK